MVAPKRDVRVSPIEELLAAATFWDDIGLVRYGLTHSIPGGDTQNVILGEAAAANERREGQHVIHFSRPLAPSRTNCFPTTFGWRTSVPTVSPRRTFGDMYFAEVRHFEEIFREGEQPAGGDAGQSSEQQQQGEGTGRQRSASRRAGGVAEADQSAAPGSSLRRAESDNVSSSDDPEVDGEFAGDAGVLLNSQEGGTRAGGHARGAPGGRGVEEVRRGGSAPHGRRHRETNRRRRRFLPTAFGGGVGSGTVCLPSASQTAGSRV